MTKYIQFNEAPENLELALERLSLSSMGDELVTFFSDIVSPIARKLYDTSEGIKVGLFDKKEIKDTVKEYEDIKKKLPYAVYTNYQQFLVPVPEGFFGTYLEYVLSLNIMGKTIYSDFNQLLADYNFLLAKFLTNKDDKISVKDYTSTYKKIALKRQEHIKSMDRFFDKNNNRTRAYLKYVLLRLSDLEPLVKETTVLMRAHDNDNVMSVADAVKKTVDMLNQVKGQLDSMEKKTSISREAANNIAAGAYELAQYAEFISVYRFRTENIMVKIHEFLAALNKAMV